jgi:hypothetical protein
MAQNKTVQTEADVAAFVARAEPPVRREEARALVARIAALTGETPRMWGPSIIGFGVHHYRYESGREGDTARIGFSPRKPALTFYGLLDEQLDGSVLASLGPHSTGKGCLYIKRLSDISLDALDGLVRRAWLRRS